MINITKLNGQEMVINSDHIQFIEETPDTVVTFMDGKKILVKENKEELVNRVIDFRKKIQKSF